MIGAIIGDIVGSRFEWNNHKSKEFELFTHECHFTDDTVLTMAVAKAIMETEKTIEPSPGRYGFDSKYYTLLSEMSIKFMQEIGRKYPYSGYGGRFHGWLFSNNPKPYNSYGNGSAMRISPAGFAARSETEAISLTKAITEITHDHEDGLKGAEATTMAIYMARQGNTKDEIKEKISTEYYPLDFMLDDIREEYAFDVSCQGSVPQAIKAFLESESFEDAIRTAISIGGDSDTIAAIAGAIAEAHYGVPEDLKKEALEYLDDELRGIYEDWQEFISGCYN
ncbi:ADP-ribosylglycohydrolase family protein [Gudongella sp. DL1XJH-153]|uniref:ADP-ribosylglycohydrolase family protein n=1 Tax=Gudongella sp. DL1XJH-153 TaxID=3409804 RepID=UPI003BB73467